MKYVQVITTGGTIASLPTPDGDVAATLSGQDLLARLGIKEDIKIKSSVTINSFNFDYATLYTVAKDVIEALKKPEIKGVVVTHGTDTIEETAYYLSLVTSSYKKPVILTGAQLDPSYPFTDGTKNLQDAIHAADSEKIANFGTLVVFAGYVYPARDVQKVDTNALQGFDAPDWGPVARVDNGRVIVTRDIKPTIHLDAVVPEPVALIRLGIGMTGKELKQMTEGYRGVVIEAFGRGNAHHTISEEVKLLVEKQIPVVLTSRCIRGAVLPVYGNGGGKDLERAGTWFAGDLAGEKARILLGTMLALGKTWEEMKGIVKREANHF